MLNHSDKIFLAVLTLAALGLRLLGLGEEALWSDEFYTLQEASLPSLSALINSSFFSEPHPPGYFLIIRFVIGIFGDSDVALRMPSAICGALTPAVYFLFLKILFPREPRVAWIGGALFAISPFHLWYSQDARSYAIVILLEALMLLALAVSQNAGGKSPRRFLWVAAALAAINHLLHFYTIFLAVAVFWFVALMARVSMKRLQGEIGDSGQRPRGIERLIDQRFAGVLIFIALSVVLSTIGIINFLHRDQVIDWFPQHYGPDLLYHVARAQWLGPMWSPLPKYAQWLGLGLGAAISMAGAASLWRGRRISFWPAALLGIFTAMILIIPVVVSLGRPIVWWGQRYLVLAVPFTVALLAVGAARHRVIMALLAILVIMQFVWIGGHYKYRQKRAWDNAAALIHKNSRPDAPVYVYPSRLAGLLARYTTDGRDVRGLEMSPDFKIKAPEVGEELWIVTLIDKRDAIRAMWQDTGIQLSTIIMETHAPGVELWAMRVEGPVAAP